MEPEAQLRPIAEAAYAAINDGDLDSFLAVLADDVEFTSLVAEAEGTTYRGHAGAREWWQTVRATFEKGRWDLLEVAEAAGRGVLHVRVTGSIGGVPVEGTMWQSVELRNGKAAWWAFYRQEQDARDAVGLG